MDKNSKNLHKGHRQRLRNKFIKEGFDKLEDYQVLEILLFYTIQQKDTNELAHKLINKFGSISAVLEAPHKSLMQVEGIGEVTASFLNMLPHISRIYLSDKDDKEKPIQTIETVYDIILNMYVGIKVERVYAFFFDVKNKLIFKGIISEGNFNSSNIYIPELVSLAINYSAAKVIISHNHPTGMALPSTDDINTTIKIYEALETINIELVDHIIVADNLYVSLNDDNFFKNILEDRKKAEKVIIK